MGKSRGLWFLHCKGGSRLGVLARVYKFVPHPCKNANPSPLILACKNQSLPAPAPPFLAHPSFLPAICAHLVIFPLFAVLTGSIPSVLGAVVRWSWLRVLFPPAPNAVSWLHSDIGRAPFFSLNTVIVRVTWKVATA